MGLEFHTPKTLCEKFPVGCQFCDLLLCDGKKESATTKITRRDFHSCVHGCEESICLREHEKYGSCNMYSEVKQTNADRIRAMSDEELAEWIATDLIEPGYNPLEKTKALWINWLKREVKDE